MSCMKQWRACESKCTQNIRIWYEKRATHTAQMCQIYISDQFGSAPENSQEHQEKLLQRIDILWYDVNITTVLWKLYNKYTRNGIESNTIAIKITESLECVWLLVRLRVYFECVWCCIRNCSEHKQIYTHATRQSHTKTNCSLYLCNIHT